VVNLKMTLLDPTWNTTVDFMNRGRCNVNDVVCGLCGNDLSGKKHLSNSDDIAS
jgi:hypothetical protein